MLHFMKYIKIIIWFGFVYSYYYNYDYYNIADYSNMHEIYPDTFVITYNFTSPNETLIKFRRISLRVN